MTESQSHSILVFFRLSLLNPKLSREAAVEAYQNISRNNPKDSHGFAIAFVKATAKIFYQSRKAARKSKKIVDHPVEVSGINLSPWRDFIRHASEEEMLAIIWLQILNLPLRAVAQGLGLSEGVLLHRLSRGVRRLSNKVEPQSPAELHARRPWR